MTGEDIVAAARRWLGTPFHHQGRVRGVGVDCAGLVIGAARELGIMDIDVTGYGHRPDDEEMERLVRAHLAEIPLAEAAPGDVLLILIDRRPQHLAIRSDVGMIHAYAPARKVVEHRIDAVWAARIHAAFRFPLPASAI
ncbi:MAG: peptidase [Roseibium sp.]